MSSSPASPERTVLHLGLGSFHRAHEAVYLHQLRESGDRSWSIVAGNIRADMEATAGALAAQQGAYTLETVTPQGERHYERITSIREVVPFTPTLERLVAGIEGRKAHVYAQRWLRLVPFVRGGLPTLIAIMPSRDIKKAEQLLRDRRQP